MSKEIFINDSIDLRTWSFGDTKCDTIAKLRWLQVKELRNKYPNDQDFGAEVAKLIKKDE